MATSSSSRELVLLVGDMHIPLRASDIDERFKRILVPNKVQQVIAAGNVTSKEQAEYLRSLAQKSTFVRGDFDDDGAACSHGASNDLLHIRNTLRADTLPDSKVVVIGGFRVAVMHGHQVCGPEEIESLAPFARMSDADVCVCAHTHAASVCEYEGRLYINPGSITGAFTPSSSLGETNPSFVLMSVSGSDIEVYRYEIVRNELKITRSYFNKDRGGEAVAAATAAASAGVSSYVSSIAATSGISAPSAYRADML